MYLYAFGLYAFGAGSAWLHYTFLLYAVGAASNLQSPIFERLVSKIVIFLAIST